MYTIEQPTSKKMHRPGWNRTLFYISATLLAVTLIYMLFFQTCDDPNRIKMVPKESVHYLYDEQLKGYPYDKNMPLLFIGGVPRSGTTLMRAMLDAHPSIRCGEETRVIPRLLGMRGQWAKSEKESKRLLEAGLTDDVIDDALAAFILEVIAKHGEPAPRLCNKDPFTLKSSVYLSHLFPNSKYILMIRDGRAVVHSIITRKITISGFDLKDFSSSLQRWNQAMESMFYQCLKVGASRCMPVYYEQLVLHPELWLKQILRFMDVEWDSSVLHHEEYINKPGGISLSKTERSTDQVVKPINMEALTAWVAFVPETSRASMRTLAPMLERLGYDPNAYPPNYGDPDTFVLANTVNIQENPDHWKQRGKDVYQQPKYHAGLKDGKVAKQPPVDVVKSDKHINDVIYKRQSVNGKNVNKNADLYYKYANNNDKLGGS